jgi:hypothetical protein
MSGGPNRPLSRRDPHAALKNQDIGDKNKAILLGLARFLIWVACVFVIIWNWINIGNLRKWADQSEWLQKENGENPESKFQGIGQIAPLASLGAAFVFFDGLWESTKKRGWLRRFDQDLLDERESQRIKKLVEICG